MFAKLVVRSYQRLNTRINKLSSDPVFPRNVLFLTSALVQNVLSGQYHQHFIGGGGLIRGLKLLLS